MATVRHIPDTEFELAVMRYIDSDADISRFVKALGTDTMRLNRLIDRLIDDHALESANDTLSLTPRGHALQKSLLKMCRHRGLYAFLMPDFLARKERIDFCDTYIPLSKSGEAIISDSLIQGRSGESPGDNESTSKPDK